jgi:hypothetical protein
MKTRLRSSEISLAHAAICVFIALPLLAAQPQNASTDVPKQETHGIIVANMDTSVRPGDDFNQYANGGWIQRTEIPPDRGEVDVFTRRALFVFTRFFLVMIDFPSVSTLPAKW